MFLRIETLAPKLLVGKSLVMSFAADRTAELWRSFMPHRKTIEHVADANLYSMQIFDSPPDFESDCTFTKWAAVEVLNGTMVPQDMATYRLSGGLYAVFLHRGPPSEFRKTFGYIFGQWMPESPYRLDHREHFELLGDKYRNGQPDSEEEVWIPIVDRPEV